MGKRSIKRGKESFGFSTVKSIMYIKYQIANIEYQIFSETPVTLIIFGG